VSVKCRIAEKCRIGANMCRIGGNMCRVVEAYAGRVSRSKRVPDRRGAGRRVPDRRGAGRRVPDRRGTGRRVPDRSGAGRRVPDRRSSQRARQGPKPYLVADIPPLDVDGVVTVAIGTAAWALTFVAMLPFYGALEDHGRAWYLWTCLAGFGGGLLGLEYCRRRRNRLNAQPSRQHESSPLGAAGL
jgi:hypothetical protein